MKKADIILIAGCFAAALILAIAFMARHDTGSVADIYCDGTLLYQIELNQADATEQAEYYLILFEEQEEQGIDVHIMHSEEYPELPVGRSYNLLSVGEGTVAMEAADCRDQICVRHKPVSADRENIICLPHRLVVEIYADKDEEMEKRKEGRPDGSEEKSDEPLDGVVG